MGLNLVPNLVDVKDLRRSNRWIGFPANGIAMPRALGLCKVACAQSCSHLWAPVES